MKILLINKETSVVEGITYLDNLEDVSLNHIVLEIKEDDYKDYMGRKYDLSSKTFSEEKFLKIEEIKTPVDRIKELEEKIELLTKALESK